MQTHLQSLLFTLVQALHDVYKELSSEKTEANVTLQASRRVLFFFFFLKKGEEKLRASARLHPEDVLSFFVQVTATLIFLLSLEDLLGLFMDLCPYIEIIKNAETTLGVREQAGKYSA